MNTEIVKYSDLSLDWTPHPLTGDVVPKTNIEAIRQSVRVLMMLGPYDIPFLAGEMADVKRALFETFTVVTQSGLRKRIEWALTTYEKRIVVHDIQVKPYVTDDGFDVTITYKIKALNVDDTLTQQFQRVR